jgi:hypothetical protein
MARNHLGRPSLWAARLSESGFNPAILMKTKITKNQAVTLFNSNILHARSALVSGDPTAAVKHLKSAIPFAGDLDTRKLVEKAHEEASIGSPAMAEYYIDNLIENSAPYIQFPRAFRPGSVKNTEL